MTQNSLYFPGSRKIFFFSQRLAWLADWQPRPLVGPLNRDLIRTESKRKIGLHWKSFFSQCINKCMQIIFSIAVQSAIEREKKEDKFASGKEKIKYSLVKKWEMKLLCSQDKENVFDVSCFFFSLLQIPLECATVHGRSPPTPFILLGLFNCQRDILMLIILFGIWKSKMLRRKQVGKYQEQDKKSKQYRPSLHSARFQPKIILHNCVSKVANQPNSKS